ncbi:MAG: hypothetical protein Q4C58_06715 [Eubacteriales bacterium]|nr:hypothetical protein [Eubacteriales bacterium]
MKDQTKRVFANWIFPLVLLVYPLLKINQGIDLTDSCYGLVNFRFFPHAGQEWTVATYLANVLGALLMRLPFGDTLIGIRFYTGLLVSAMALLAYYFLRGKMPAWLAFTGEAIAVSLCWIPTTSLYNYLTFFLFLCGSVTLYRGLVWQRRMLMALAGVFLGLSVLTRLPNILECGLVIAVVYYGILKKKQTKEVRKDIGACVGGFLAAFLAGFLAICLQFGVGAYGEMLAGLSGYSSTDETYSVFSMIASVLGAYGAAFKWVLLLLTAAAMGWVMFLIAPGRLEKAKMVLYVCMLPVLLRLLWGRGMFNFQYAFYWSVFEWCMVFLYAAVGFCIWALVNPLIFRRDKLLALIVLLIILITPIGSNNETYPNMNNLFLVAPVTLWFGYRIWLALRPKKAAFPLRAMFVFVAGFFLIQSLGFGVRAVFRDSIEGQKRDSLVTGNKKLAGVKTNAQNAAALQDVVDFINDSGLGEGYRTLITFGDVPGFGWIFDMPSELSHDWPDMNTYPVETMRRDLENVLYTDHDLPIVIVNYANVDFEEEQEAAKWQLLQEFMELYGYEARMDNGVYQIYFYR